MLTIEGNEIRFDGVAIGYVLADRATHMKLRDYIDEIHGPRECAYCDSEAIICVDCVDDR